MKDYCKQRNHNSILVTANDKLMLGLGMALVVFIVGSIVLVFGRFFGLF